MSKAWFILFLSLGFLVFAHHNAPASFEEEGGVRMMGMGGAFVALGDDAQTVQSNPAGLWFLGKYHLTVSHLRQYVGLDSDRLSYSYLAFASPFGKWGVLGVYNGFLNSSIYRENAFGVSYGYGIGNFLSFGVTGKILWKFFAENQDTIQDPFFSEFGFNKRVFAVDIGMILRPSEYLSFGVVARNLNRPNMSFDPQGKDYIPRSITFGVSSKLMMFNPLVDIELVDQKLNGDYHIRYHLGLEAKLFADRLALRGGYQNRQITTGLGYEFGSEEGFQFGIEYAFMFPLQSIKSTYGSHNLGLSLAFGAREKKPRGLTHFEFNYPGKDITSVSVDTIKELEPEKVTSSASTLAKEGAYSIFGLDSEHEGVYSYMHITSTIVQEDFKRVEIRYRVSKQWLTSNNIDSASLRLMRYDEITDSIEVLKSQQVGDDELYFYFIATNQVL